MRQTALPFPTSEGLRFDLDAPGFIEHLRRLTGLGLADPKLSTAEQAEEIRWWNTATEEDAAHRVCNDGSACDFRPVWRLQTRKIQIVWDAWLLGQRITLEEVYRKLGIE